MGYIDGDTYVTTASFDVCLRATAIWVRAVDDAVASAAMMDDDAVTTAAPATYTFALTRPPGHHATYDSSNGFCLYNFAAAAAFHAVVTSGTTMTKNGQRQRARVAILDWDVHYGQGVADIVGRRRQRDGHGPMTEEEPWQNYVRYASIHQTPAFPYQGEKRQTVGNVRTIPVPPDTTWTCVYKEAYIDALDFLMGGEDVDDDSCWHPDVVIVCAGYDALASDELAGTSLTQDDYYRMTRLLCERILLKQQSTTTTGRRRRPVKLMLGLEGGYQLGDDCGPSGNFPDALVRTLEALLETT
jgi:acetoin utilization deacetylase AcuC-like enzyme